MANVYYNPSDKYRTQKSNSTTSAMNYSSGPFASPTPSAMNYNSGSFAAPKATTTTKSSGIPYSSSVLEEQKKLQAAGYYTGALDGKAGPLTQAAREKAKSATYAYNPLDADFAPVAQKPKENVVQTAGIQYADQYPGTPNVVENKTMQPDYTQYLIDMVQNQFKYNNQADINAIRQAYEQGRGQLQGQIPGVHQNARSAYDANDAYYHTQALPELRAAMEQAGLYRGGDMLGGNVDLLTMRGQNAGQISQDQMNQLNAIQQAISQLNIDEGLKVAEVEAANNAAEAQALINAANMGMQNQLALADRTGNILGTDTLTKIQQAYEQAMGIADRTGNMPDGSKTLAAQQLAADLAYRQQQFEESVRQFNANYGIDLKRLSLDQVQQELDNKYRMGQLSLQQKNQALNEAQFAYQKEQDLLNYNQQTSGAANYADYYNKVLTQVDNSPYLYKDALGQIQVTNKKALKDYIISLFPNDAAYDQYIDKLLMRYGLPTN